MNTVKVKREDLLTKVRANREAHRDLFLKAQEGYRKLVIEELDRMLADANEGRPTRARARARPGRLDRECQNELR
jgi:hypothetical protein